MGRSSSWRGPCPRRRKRPSTARDLGLGPRIAATRDWQAMLEGEQARPEGDRIDFVSIVALQPRALSGGTRLRRCRVPRRLRQADDADSRRRPTIWRRWCRSGASSSVSPTTTRATRWSSRHATWCGLGCNRRDPQGHRGIQPGVARHRTGGVRARSRPTGGRIRARSGAGGAIGDIGSHAEQLVSNITGLEIELLLSDLTSFIDGRRGSTTTPTCCFGSSRWCSRHPHRVAGLRRRTQRPPDLRVWGTTGRADLAPGGSEHIARDERSTGRT